MEKTIPMRYSLPKLIEELYFELPVPVLGKDDLKKLALPCRHLNDTITDRRGNLND